MKKHFAKAVAVTLGLLIILCSLPVVSVFAAYENTHVNTGDQAADIVAVAKTQIGYHEGSLAGTTSGSNNYTKYGVWYDKKYDVGNGSFSYGAWCAMFVSWCADQAGIPADIVYPHAYCPYGVTWYKNHNIWKDRSSGYVPKAGDIIYFQSSGSASHIGIVTGCNGSTVYTVEGNTSSATYDPEGNVCADKSYALSNTRIMGYGTPNYETGNVTSAAKLGTYKITASSLNVREGASTDYEVVDAVLKGELVVVSELNSSGWGKVTTPSGKVGWCAITQYGDYIGLDALGYGIKTGFGDPDYSYKENGSLVISNPGGEVSAVDLELPLGIGTGTT
ncbi:MAG: CHAP domain-containing protein, partial [Clostridia bacterium]|nr:CHAP domain-containing protein [Clostridia bacterium]